jgi:hypothetical protein
VDVVCSVTPGQLSKRYILPAITPSTFNAPIFRPANVLLPQWLALSRLEERRGLMVAAHGARRVQCRVVKRTKSLEPPMLRKTRTE